MITVSITKLYDLLSVKMGSEAAENLTTYIEEKIRDEFNSKSTILATKEDLVNLRADNIKWMFIFWIGQVGVTFGFILFLLKK
jgi:hypothetical protein